MSPLAQLAGVFEFREANREHAGFPSDALNWVPRSLLKMCCHFTTHTHFVRSDTVSQNERVDLLVFNSFVRRLRNGKRIKETLSDATAVGSRLAGRSTRNESGSTENTCPERV